MTRARAALLLLPIAAMALLPVAVGPMAGATSRPQGVPADRHALVLVMGGAPFDQVLSVPALRQLAREGGAGLMTTAVPGPDQEKSSYLTIGAGAKASGDDVSVGARLADALEAAGVSTCVAAAAADPLTLLAGEGTRRQASVDGCPVAAGVPDVTVARLPMPPAAAGQAVRGLVERAPNEATLVIVVAPQPSPAMIHAGDETTALIVARGLPATLFPANGSMHGLTSDTTRYEGLAANVDVAPTVLDWFGVPVPSSMDGLPVRVDEGTAPFGLYDDERGYRHIRFLVQVAEGALVTAAGLFAMGALWAYQRRSGLSERWRAGLRYVALAGATLPAATLTGGLVPSFDYVTVTIWLVAIVTLLPLLALRVGASMGGPIAPYRFLAAATLALFVIDADFGFHAMRVPLEGGVMFDGVRFYGIPNAGAGPLLASSVVVAAGWRPRPGTALLVVAGLFAGLPWLGADVGGAIGLFFAAGLWWSLRVRRRIGVREVLLMAAVTVVGVALVLAVSRYGPGAPTHATHFVERTGGRVGAFVSDAGHRLGIGLRQLVHFPEAIPPLLGLPVLAWLAVGRRGPFDAAFADERLRHVMLVLAACSVVEYFANDTGLTAAAPLFLYGLTVALYAVCAAPLRERIRP